MELIFFIQFMHTHIHPHKIKKQIFLLPHIFFPLFPLSNAYNIKHTIHIQYTNTQYLSSFLFVSQKYTKNTHTQNTLHKIRFDPPVSLKLTFISLSKTHRCLLSKLRRVSSVPHNHMPPFSLLSLANLPPSELNVGWTKVPPSRKHPLPLFGETHQ